MPLPGSATVVCGDSTTEAAYDRALAGRKARLLLTDPPYCVLTRRRKGGDLRDKKNVKLERGPLKRFEDVRAYRRFTDAWLPRAAARLEPGAPLVVWTNFLGKGPIAECAAAHGYPALAGEFVWGKRTSEKQGSELTLRVYETALVFLPEPLPAPTDASPALPWSVVAGYDEDGEAQAAGGHPSHKPFGVLEPLLRTWSRPGDLVLDPFGGSGSTAAACLRLGRAAATIEVEAEWAERIAARVARLGAA